MSRKVEWAQKLARTRTRSLISAETRAQIKATRKQEEINAQREIEFRNTRPALAVRAIDLPEDHPIIRRRARMDEAVVATIEYQYLLRGSLLGE